MNSVRLFNAQFLRTKQESTQPISVISIGYLPPNLHCETDDKMNQQSTTLTSNNRNETKHRNKVYIMEHIYISFETIVLKLIFGYNNTLAHRLASSNVTGNVCYFASYRP